MNDEQYIVELVVNVQQDQAVKKLLADMKNLSQQVGGSGTLPKGLEATGKAASNTVKPFQKMGYQVQNASYQLTDFIVQVQGGIDPMRAFSQQAPQLLGSFGAVGAAVGVIAALLPSAILAFSKSKDAIGKLSEEADQATAAMESFASALQRLDEVGGQTARRLVELNGAFAQLEHADMMKALDVKELSTAGVILRVLKDGVVGIGGAIGDLFEKLTVSIPVLREYMMAIKDAQQRQLEFEKRFQTEAQGVLGGRFSYDIDTGTSVDRLVEDFAFVEKQMEKITEIRNRAKKELGSVPEEVDSVYQMVKTSYDRMASAADAYTKSAADAVKTPLQELQDRQAELLRDFNRGLLGSGEAAQERYEILAREAAQAWYDQQDEITSMWEEMGTGGMRIFDSFVNGVAAGTAKLKDLFKNMVKAMIAEALKLMAYRWVFGMLGGAGTDNGRLFGENAGFLKSGTQPGTYGQADGGVWNNGVQMFARGGVVNGPTLFPMAKGMGLMGEAGPEAIMPLSRGADGKLGVAGGGMNVTVNNNAGGVDIQTSEDANGGLTIEVIRRTLAADVQSGGNPLSDAIGRNFGLSRGAGAY